MVLNETILCGGDNTYKHPPHAGKDKLIRKFKHNLPLCPVPCMVLLCGTLRNGVAISPYMSGRPIVGSSGQVIWLILRSVAYFINVD